MCSRAGADAFSPRYLVDRLLTLARLRRAVGRAEREVVLARIAHSAAPGRKDWPRVGAARGAGNPGRVVCALGVGGEACDKGGAGAEKSAGAAEALVHDNAHAKAGDAPK